MKKRWENPDVTELSVKATAYNCNNGFGGDEHSPAEFHPELTPVSGEILPTNPFQPPMNGHKPGHKPGHNHGKH